jgi:hypothetical protein
LVKRQFGLDRVETAWRRRSTIWLRSLRAFAGNYPQARLRVVARDAQPAFTREYDGVPVDFGGLEEAMARIVGEA